MTIASDRDTKSVCLPVAAMHASSLHKIRLCHGQLVSGQISSVGVSFRPVRLERRREVCPKLLILRSMAMEVADPTGLRLFTEFCWSTCL